MLSASEVIASKLQCSIGCVTRSSASGNSQQIGHSKDTNVRSTVNLMDLPVELIQNIISLCGYKTVANLRVVSILFVTYLFIVYLYLFNITHCMSFNLRSYSFPR